VAHGCFWKYHPARAYAWELRLQDELDPDFRIEETDHLALRQVYLDAQPEEALAAIEKEALRRLRKKKAPQPSLTLLDAGLWSTLPGTCWSLELKLADKQGVDFRLLAPDEPSARAAFEREHPRLVAERTSLMSSLTPMMLVLPDDDEPTVDAEDSEDEPDEDAS
jgi:hypothetical protein